MQALNCFFLPELCPLGGISQWLLRLLRPSQRKNFSTCPSSSTQRSCPRKEELFQLSPIKCLSEIITPATEASQPLCKTQSCVCLAGTNSKVLGSRKKQSRALPTPSVIPGFNLHYWCFFWMVWYATIRLPETIWDERKYSTITEASASIQSLTWKIAV